MVFLFDVLKNKQSLVRPEDALPGRDVPLQTASTHAVSGNPLAGPYPDRCRQITFALGCFWGAERLFWQQTGVWVTAAGYAGGTTRHPTYHEVCTGMTGHTEVVLVVYDPALVSLEVLLTLFWEGHDPTQGMRQGNDVGTQYRSAIYTDSETDLALVRASAAAYQAALTTAGKGTITTEMKPAGPFYFAEEYHQQYLHKNPSGYCGLGGTGVACPRGREAVNSM